MIAHDAARTGTYVGATVTTELGLVVHTTECDAHELASEGARDRFTERRLADARRPHEGQDRTRAAGAGLGHPALGAQLADREVLDDPVFHVVEPGVVGVEDGARVTNFELVVGARAPWDLERGVDPRTDSSVLGTLLAGALEPVDSGVIATSRAGSHLPRAWSGSRR